MPIDKNYMLVVGLNRILNWCHVSNGRAKYTCYTKEIDGELFFKFRKAWHPVAKYVADNAEELVQEGGRVFSRPFKK